MSKGKGTQGVPIIDGERPQLLRVLLVVWLSKGSTAKVSLNSGNIPYLVAEIHGRVACCEVLSVNG